MKQLKNKKAEIGETMTWFVATLVIIVFLAVSIFVVSLLKNERKITTFSFGDSVAAKSLSAFMLTKDGEEIIFNKISEDDDLTEFSGKLSVKVLKEPFDEIYSNIALKGSDKNNKIELPNSVKNKYWEFSSDCLVIQERIYFPGNKHLRLCLDK